MSGTWLPPARVCDTMFDNDTIFEIDDDDDGGGKEEDEGEGDDGTMLGSQI